MADADHGAILVIERKIAEGGDPVVTAREIMAALRGLGYRPTSALPSPPWRVQGHGGGPVRPETAALLEAARADCAAAAARNGDGDG